MELWFLFALVSAIASGFWAFGQKMAVERKYDVHFSSAIISIWTVLCTAIIILFQGGIEVRSVDVLMGAISGVLYLLTCIARYESLQFIDTTIYFPLYKVIGTGIVTLLSIVFLSDHLTSWEFFGVALTCVIPLLLITPREHARQKNLTSGLSFMGVSTIIAAVNATTNAYAIGFLGTNPLVLLFVADLFVILTGILFFIYTRREHALREARKEITTFSFIAWTAVIGVIHFVSFYTLLLAYQGGSPSIVYSINAHYIVIGVVLAVWFYKEHWNVQKAVALVLSVLAIIFMHR